MVLNRVIGRCLAYDKKLTLSRTGLIRIAGPNMNCWSISHVSLSFVNLKNPIWRNSSLGLSKHAQSHCLEKEATLTHGEGVGRRCCPQCELYASGYTDMAAGSIWSAALSLSIPQRLNSRPRDLVSKGVSEHTVSSSSLHPRDLRRGWLGAVTSLALSSLPLSAPSVTYRTSVDTAPLCHRCSGPLNKLALALGLRKPYQ